MEFPGVTSTDDFENLAKAFWAKPIVRDSDGNTDIVEKKGLTAFPQHQGSSIAINYTVSKPVPAPSRLWSQFMLDLGSIT